MRLALTCFLLMVFLLAAGCGRSGPRTYRVSGTVTFNGKPVNEGDILFVPADTARGPTAAKIANGKYVAEAAAGVCRVEISAIEIGPNTPRVDGVPIPSNYLPARYNMHSELSVEVEPHNRNVFNFELTSK